MRLDALLSSGANPRAHGQTPIPNVNELIMNFYDLSALDEETQEIEAKHKPPVKGPGAHARMHTETRAIHSSPT